MTDDKLPEWFKTPYLQMHDWKPYPNNPDLFWMEADILENGRTLRRTFYVSQKREVVEAHRTALAELPENGRISQVERHEGDQLPVPEAKWIGPNESFISKPRPIIVKDCVVCGYPALVATDEPIPRHDDCEHAKRMLSKMMVQTHMKQIQPVQSIKYNTDS